MQEDKARERETVRKRDKQGRWGGREKDIHSHTTEVH